MPLDPSLKFETLLWRAGYIRLAGIDEAGRGAWAGPVCAAAVILPPDATILKILQGVRDSKMMSAAARTVWAPRIQAASLAWGVGFASPQEIDHLGILPATKLAAGRALVGLEPDYLLTDFLVFPALELPQTALIKGDRDSLTVAAASVLAKTVRDERMRLLDREYPGYDFARHKGYGTRVHQEAIRQLGRSGQHRKSFSLASLERNRS